MDPASSPHSFGDFIVVESDISPELVIRPRLRQQEIQQYPDDQSSDSDLEHISRPGSVRSLSTRSPSPSIGVYRDQDGDISMTNNDQNLSSLYLDTASGHDTSSRPVQCAIGYSRRAPSATQAPLMTPSTKPQATRTFTYQRSPDDAFPSVDVLTPPPASTVRQTYADLGLSEHSIPHKLVDGLCLDYNTQRCDHATIDQHIIDILIENALDTRVEHEVGSSAPRDQNLRQQMMARLKSLPVDHPVVKEATKHAGRSPFLFKHEACDNAERRHTYLDVFTSVELAALHLLLRCHEKHFVAACSFADVASTLALQFLGTIDPSTITQGFRLALRIQECCAMGTSIGSVRLFVNQNQLLPHTRTAIKRQAESLERHIDTQAAQRGYLGASTGKSSNACPAKDGEARMLKYAHYERIATRDVLNDTLQNLIDVRQQEVEQQSQNDARRPLCSKRQAPQDGAEKAWSCLGLPAKRLSMPRAHPANAEIIQSTTPIIPNSYVVLTSDDPKTLTIEGPYKRDASVVVASVPDDKSTDRANQQVLQRQLMLPKRQNRRPPVLRSRMPERLRDQAQLELHLASSNTLILPPRAPASSIDVVEGVKPVSAVNVPAQEMHYITQQQQHQHQDLWQRGMWAERAARQQQDMTQARLRALRRDQQRDSQSTQTSKPQPLTDQAPQSQSNRPSQAQLESSILNPGQLRAYQAHLMVEYRDRKLKKVKSEVEQAVLESSTSTEPPLQDNQVKLMALEQKHKNLQIVRTGVIDDAVDRELSNYVREEDGVKFRSMVPDQDCTKLFKERDYWKRHVEKKHKDWYHELRYDFCSDWSTFIASSEEPNEGSSTAPSTTFVSTPLPIRSAADEKPHRHETSITSGFSYGCRPQRESGVQYSTLRSDYEPPDTGVPSPIQSSDNSSATSPDNETFVNDSSLEATRLAKLCNMPPGQHNYHWQLRLLEQENKIRLMESRIEEAKSIGICTKEFYRDLGREKYNKRCIELEALKQSDNAGTAREQPQVPLEQGNRKGSDAIELALSTAAVQAQEHQPHVPIQGSSTPTTRQLAVWFDKDGVPWTTFKWSSGTGQERVAYTMRCDICYTAPALSPEFKYANTLCSHQLETVKLGWKFAYLNPFLHRGKFQLHLLRAAVNHYKQLEAEGRLGPASFLQGSRLSNQSTNTDCVASQLCIEHMADAGGLDSDDRFASLSCLDFVEFRANKSDEYLSVQCTYCNIIHAKNTSWQSQHLLRCLPYRRIASGSPDAHPAPSHPMSPPYRSVAAANFKLTPPEANRKA